MCPAPFVSAPDVSCAFRHRPMCPAPFVSCAFCVLRLLCPAVLVSCAFLCPAPLVFCALGTCRRGTVLPSYCPGQRQDFRRDAATDYIHKLLSSPCNRR